MVASPAAAAERTWPVASFSRLRVEGPVAVEVATGSPRAQATADDRTTLARMTVQLDGETLLVRLPDTADAPRARVVLATPRLTALLHRGIGDVAVARLTGERVDVASTGGGAVSVAGVDAPMLAATLVGEGELKLAGRAARARLALNGPGLLDAASLVVDETDVSLVGDGELRGAARYGARVRAVGKGRVAVTGPMPCGVRASGGATVACGK